MPSISRHQRKTSEQPLTDENHGVPLHAAVATSPPPPSLSSSSSFVRELPPLRYADESVSASSTLRSGAPFYYDQAEPNEERYYACERQAPQPEYRHRRSPLARSAPFGDEYEYDGAGGSGGATRAMSPRRALSPSMPHSLPRPTLTRPYRSNYAVYSSYSPIDERPPNVSYSQASCASSSINRRYERARHAHAKSKYNSNCHLHLERRRAILLSIMRLAREHDDEAKI